MDELRFTLDGFEDEHVWDAVAFGPAWNGWATPVVTRETLIQVLSQLHSGHRWDGDIAIVWPTIELEPGEEHGPGEEDRLPPDIHGRYDLGTLGWVFVRV